MMKAAVWFAVAGTLLAANLGGRAQTSGMGANMTPMDGMHAFPPPEQLPIPEHMTGIGNSHISIKATPEAQAWFDQGLSLLHDFWDYESAKAFEQAIRTDPQLRHVLLGACAGARVPRRSGQNLRHQRPSTRP